jgi:hypothetical protein
VPSPVLGEIGYLLQSRVGPQAEVTFLKSFGDDGFHIAELIALPVKLPHHPVVLEEQERRAADIQLWIADWITGFAGSMNFVYLHVALFAV